MGYSNRLTTFLSAAFLLASALPAAAIDVSGKIVDRFWNGLADASVCAAAGSPCVRSAADGSFRLQGPVAVGPMGAGAGASLVGYSLEAHGGTLMVRSPRSLIAWIDWSAPDGRRNRERIPVGLEAGLNALPAPKDAGGGLRILRLSAPGVERRFLVLVQGGAFLAASPGRAGGMEDRLRLGNGNLAKESAERGAPNTGAAPSPGAVPSQAALTVTKPGFAAATYQAAADTEKDAIILLSPPGENTLLLFNGRNFDGWDMSAKAIGNAPGSWVMQDGAFHSLGTIRGTLSTKQDFGSFRILFTLRHLPSTGSDHMPCVVIWGSRPPPNDALGGIQFQPPNGGHWDYRPGKNNGGSGFTAVAHVNIDRAQWSQCEIWAKQSTGEARMACCNLAGKSPCKGVEVLRFKDATAGKKGPLGLQIHNTGLHDQYKNITLEVDPGIDDLITTKL